VAVLPDFTFGFCIGCVTYTITIINTVSYTDADGVSVTKRIARCNADAIGDSEPGKADLALAGWP